MLWIRSQTMKTMYTVPEIMSILGVSKNAVYTLIRNNSFKTYRTARGYLIPISSFENWLYEGKVQ